MKKYIIILVLIIILFVPFIKNPTRCLGAIGPDNPTGNQCLGGDYISIVGWLRGNI